MAARKRRERTKNEFKFSLKAVRNPAKRSTFGDVGAFFQVSANNEFANELLEIPYKKAAAKNVDESTLRLFWWDKSYRSLRLVEPSGVDVERRMVWGRIGEAGVYGAIGLHNNEDVQRTISILGQFTAQELQEQPELIPPICGLILCAGPAPLGDAGNLCDLCIGLEVPQLHIPDVQLVRLKRFDFADRIPKLPAPVWPTVHQNARNTRQSQFNGPRLAPSVQWMFELWVDRLWPPLVGADGTVYVAAFTGLPGQIDTGITFFALNGINGNVKWSLSTGAFETNGLFEDSPAALGARGSAYVGLESLLRSIAPTGVVEWGWTGRQPNSPSYMYPTPASNGTVYVNDLGDVVAIAPNGGTQWRRPLTFSPGFGLDFVFAVRDDNSLLIPGDELTAVDGTNGQVLWTYSPGPNGFVRRPVVANDGQIAVHTSAGGQILSSSGVFQRSFPAGEVAIAESGVMYVAAGPSLLALNTAGGTLWTRNFPSDLCVPAIAKDGTLYVFHGSTLAALDPSTGADVWSVALPAGTLGVYSHVHLAIGLQDNLVLSSRTTVVSLS